MRRVTTTSISIPAELLEEIRKQAEQDHVSVSTYITRALYSSLVSDISNDEEG